MKLTNSKEDPFLFQAKWTACIIVIYFFTQLVFPSLFSTHFFLFWSLMTFLSCFSIHIYSSLILSHLFIYHIPLSLSLSLFPISTSTLFLLFFYHVSLSLSLYLLDLSFGLMIFWSLCILSNDFVPNPIKGSKYWWHQWNLASPMSHQWHGWMLMILKNKDMTSMILGTLATLKILNF